MKLQRAINPLLLKTAVLALFILLNQVTNAQTIFWVESLTNLVRTANYDGVTPIVASGSTTTTIAAANTPVYSSIDRANGRIYWTNNLTGTISRSTISSPSPNVVVSGLTAGSLEGLYLDITNNFVYWTEKGVGTTDRIRRVNISGTLPKSVSDAVDVVTGIDIVRGIAVDTGASKFIYYANAGSGSGGKGIYRVQYTGSTIAATSATLIAQTGIVQPQQLFLDRYNHFIYWSDYAASATANIGRVSTATGTVYPATPITVFSGESVRGIHFNAAQSTIYWTEPKNLRIRKGIVTAAAIPAAAQLDVVTNLTGFPRNMNYVALDLVVPVVFISAKAYPAGKAISVDWSISSETNTESYSVERSADGISFSDAGSVPAQGNAASAEYSFKDFGYISGENYYRIRANGSNGSKQFSSILKVTMNGVLPSEIAVNPNPIQAGEPIRVRFQNAEPGDYNLRLFADNGQEILTQQYKYSGGSGFISLNKSVLSGIYRLAVTSNGKRTVINVIVQ